MEREQSENEAFLKAVRDIQEALRLAGAGVGVSVIIIDEMTTEEKEMEIMAGFLKEGRNPAEAEREAKEWVEMLNALEHEGRAS